MQKRGGEKGRERGGWEGKDNSFCSAGERLKGGGRKRKKKKNEPTYVHNRIFWCLIYFRGVGLVGWLVRKGRGEKKRDQIEREMSSYV